MKTEQVNIDALADAIRIVFNETDLTKLEAVYKTVNAAEIKGHADGYALGCERADATAYDLGHAEGSKEEYVDGFADGQTWASDDSFEDGFDAGYEQARRDLGECPTIDADFDDQSVYDWRDLQLYATGC